MNDQESEVKFNQHENRENGSREVRSEVEKNEIKGAEMLENPPDGSFVHGLQLFVAWVKSLVADDK